MDELIAKRLSGEATPDEEQALNGWLREDPDHQRYFEQMQRLWQQAPGAAAGLVRPVDTEAALARVKSRFGSTAPTAGGGRVVRFQQWWLAAAAAVAVLVATWWWLQPSNAAQAVQLAATEQALNDTLSDGTVVALNRQSGLTATFSGRERRVKMRGEAYFDVAHDASKPFVIEARELEIRVLGTAFNVDNLSDDNTVRVQVTRGKVQLRSGSQQVLLTAGQQATFDRRTGQISAISTLDNPTVATWRDGRFNFEDTPLSEVVAQLEQAYGVRIVLKNNVLEKCRVQSRYKNDEPLERILELLCDTFSLTYEQRDGVYYLDGPGCGE
jgi:ferric-dicitrate binding protein FerR (iron transport regulator)